MTLQTFPLIYKGRAPVWLLPTVPLMNNSSSSSSLCWWYTHFSTAQVMMTHKHRPSSAHVLIDVCLKRLIRSSDLDSTGECADIAAAQGHAPAHTSLSYLQYGGGNLGATSLLLSTCRCERFCIGVAFMWAPVKVGVSMTLTFARIRANFHLLLCHGHLRLRPCSPVSFEDFLPHRKKGTLFVHVRLWSTADSFYFYSTTPSVVRPYVTLLQVFSTWVYSLNFYWKLFFFSYKAQLAAPIGCFGKSACRQPDSQNWGNRREKVFLCWSIRNQIRMQFVDVGQEKKTWVGRKWQVMWRVGGAAGVTYE